MDPKVAQYLLRVMLHHISEERWCASWLDGVEYWAWENAFVLPDEGEESELAEIEISCLRELSLHADGWWHWDINMGEPGFVDLPLFEQMYNAHHSIKEQSPLRVILGED